MRYRTLGKSGMKVSPYCLGAMMFGAWGNTDHDECVRIIHEALDRGINFVDTADVYSGGESESIVGKALKGRRDSVILATKECMPITDDPNARGASRRWITHQVETSLKRLGTDWIDLYQIHRPDPTTAIDETLSALTDLVNQGKVHAIGTSTFPAELIVEAQWASERNGYERFRCEQPPYSIFVRGIESNVLPTIERYAMGAICWSPLAGGWLSGRYRRAEDIDMTSGRPSRVPARFDPALPGTQLKLDAINRLGEIADDLGTSIVQLALAFVVAHPAVTAAIIGPRTLDQLREMLDGATLELDDEVLDRIDAIVPPGTNLSSADAGWVPPALANPSDRRRQHGQRAAGEGKPTG